MRIIAGTLRGRRLSSTEGVRPTGDRVRSALFSILGGRLEGTFVDAFAGTGAVGLEAFSRGASVVLIERDPDACAVVRENVRALEARGVRLVEGDVLRVLKLPAEAPGAPFGPRPEPVRWIFADPPYDYGPKDKLMRTLAASPLVGPMTDIVLEHRRGTVFGRGELELQRQEIYGESALSFFRASSRASADDSATSAS